MENKVIRVSSTVSEKVAVDYVTVTLSAVGEAKKYCEAVDKADAAADGAVKTLNKAGIEVRAQGVSVSTVRDGKRVVGYRATRKYSAGLEFDKVTLGYALDALAATDCEWSISFSVKNKAEASKRLVQRAVETSRERAETIAEAAGVKLGKLSSVEYGANDFDGGVAVMRTYAAGGAPNVDPEDITLSETVTCSWEII